MGHSRRLSSSLLLVAAILILAVTFRSFLMVYLIRPIALMFWAAWRVMATVHQGVYWAMLIFVCMALAARLLPPEGHSPPPAAYRPRGRRPARVQYWLSLMAAGSAHAAERGALRTEMRNLLASVIAQSGRPEHENPIDLPGPETAALSQAARRFVAAGSDAEEDRDKGGTASIAARLRRWLVSSRRDDEASISEILSWMESRLEIPDDH